MLFSKQKTIDSTAPKKRSTLVTLLNPEFGASIRPIGESTRVFINLIAMLFAMNGLFPKDHPAFANGSDVRLKLGSVIGTAWNNLTFTKKDMPKTLFFFAVVSCMVMTSLAVIIGLFSLFIGTAHAQTSSSSSAFFTLPGNDTHDLAQNWIDYMFQGKPLDSSYNQGVDVVPTSTINIQCAMMTALGFYSDAVLMVAALILFYHLASMVVETAHHGVAMGKRANQVWAPIRLVVAVGLLVPIGSNGPAACGTSGAGLNSAQYITIKIAELGSALASNTWQKFVTTLGGLKFNFIPPPTPDVERLVAGMWLTEGCMAIWNQEVGYSTPTIPVLAGEEVARNQNNNQSDGTIDYDYSTPLIIGKNLCGKIHVPQPSIVEPPDPNLENTITGDSTVETVVSAVGQAQQTTLTNMLNEIQGYVTTDVPAFLPTWNATANGDAAAKNNADFQKTVNDYIAQLRSNINSALGTTTISMDQEVITSIGWVGAGAWMNTISRDQGKIIAAAKDGLPTVDPPQFENFSNWGSPLATTSVRALNSFVAWLQNGYLTADASAQPPPCSQGAAAPLTGASQPVSLDSQSGLNIQGPAQAAFGIVEKLAITEGLWEVDQNYHCAVPAPGNVNYTGFSLGRQFNSANPLGELTEYGHKNILAGFDMLNLMFYSAVAQSAGAFVGAAATEIDRARSTSGISAEDWAGWKQKLMALSGGEANAISTLGAVGVTIFGFLATIFLTVGITLAYILPLIPFMHFFFGIVAWGLVLLEGVIAMPLVALAHLTPEGDGLPGGMAKQAYFMLLGLFLRPVLMIFGFIASLLIFFLAMILLNKLFAITVVGTGGMAHGYTTISRIVFSVIYVFLAYTCAINCFKIVDNLPEAVFKWINANIQHQRIADGGSTLQQAAPLVTGYMAQQGIGQAQQASGTIASGAGTLGSTTARMFGPGGSGPKPTGSVSETGGAPHLGPPAGGTPRAPGGHP